jgi:hypothetical protein
MEKFFEIHWLAAGCCDAAGAGRNGWRARNPSRKKTRAESKRETPRVNAAETYA